MMKHFNRWLAVGLAFIYAAQSFAASVVYNPAPFPIFTSTGRAAAGAKAYFYAAGTTTPFVVYQDNALTVPHSTPVVASAAGVLPTIYVPYTSTGYRARVETSTGTVISDVDGIANPAPASGGGGGGGSVTADQIFQTGDVKWSPRIGALDGFVRLNGRSIGSATSGATERANPDTSALYSFLWNNVSDTFAPVGGGRGATAAADFAANKPLSLPDGRGRSLWGIDDMGNVAANTAQKSTTVTTTSASVSVTVASVTGLAIGMRVVSANIPSTAVINDISGSNLTLSQAATATASGTAARFSMFADAQSVAATGGGQTQTLNQRELSVSLGTAVTTITNGTSVFRGGVLGGATGAAATTPSSIDNISASTAIVNPIGGLAHTIMPPGLAGGLYMKL